MRAFSPFFIVSGRVRFSERSDAVERQKYEKKSETERQKKTGIYPAGLTGCEGLIYNIYHSKF